MTSKQMDIDVALAHHWLFQMSGGEKVLEQFCLLFPSAPIYTLFSSKEKLSPELQCRSIRSSFLGRLPHSNRHYQKMLPLFPAALKKLRPEGHPQFLLSSDASVMKGLNCDPSIPHVCYCHSLPSDLWDRPESRLKPTSGLDLAGRLAFKASAPYIRNFDYQAAQRVDRFIASSLFVANRILMCYDKRSHVIHPPVDANSFRHDRDREDFYLIASDLAPDKRIDLAVEAFNHLGRKLVIIGAGPELEELQAQAKPNIAFLGRQPSFVLKHHYERCRAFILPGVEDVGITALEAQAAGAPVIGYGRGGAAETVIEGRTGCFFQEQSPQSLEDTIARFEAESHLFSPIFSRLQAEKFSPEQFRRKMKSYLAMEFPDLFADDAWPDQTDCKVQSMPESSATLHTLKAA
jgi:hypothetical protein